MLSNWQRFLSEHDVVLKEHGNIYTGMMCRVYVDDIFVCSLYGSDVSSRKDALRVMRRYKEICKMNKEAEIWSVNS